MVFNKQHKAEGSLQYGWGTASCPLQKELPAGCVFLCYWGPDQDSNQICVAEDTNVGQHFSCTF